ncbi:MAG TPA: DUF1697 domain-containing protein, partial [Pyrinomonadaceae bacterium]|nr:DUF1697 domain-containing protein [Pyrinomonadaceae bacterium]
VAAHSRELTLSSRSNDQIEMPKYIAFLRAINVGGHLVKMDHLRRLFVGIGFTNVETFIASGNVIFDATSKSSRSLEKKIESCLLEALGYEVLTFVRSVPEVVTIANYKPFPDAELVGNTLYIGFMATEPEKKAHEKLRQLLTKMDDFHLQGREVYWLCRGKFSETPMSGGLIAKTLGLPSTIRNVTTVKKLAAKYSPEPAPRSSK